MCIRNRFDSTMHLPRWEIARTKSVQYSFNIVSMFNYDVLVDYMRTFFLPESSHLWLLFSWFFGCWSKNPIIDHTRLSQAWLWIVFELLFFSRFVLFVLQVDNQSAWMHVKLSLQDIWYTYSMVWGFGVARGAWTFLLK